MTGHDVITRPLSFQMMVDGSVTTAVLPGLTPLTEYLVNVYSVVGEQSSEPLKGTETTCKCVSSSPPSSFFLAFTTELQETFPFMREVLFTRHWLPFGCD